MNACSSRKLTSPLAREGSERQRMLLTFKVNGNSLRFAPSPAAFRLANMGSTRRPLPQGETKGLPATRAKI